MAEIELQLKFESEMHQRPVIVVCANKIELRPTNLETIVDDYEAKLWADVHGFSYCEASAATGHGVGDMFHTFFSQIVKQQVELDRIGSLPRTPASAKRVTPISGSGGSSATSTNQNRRSFHAMSPAPELVRPKLPQPSDDQQAVMSRLGRGI